MSRPLKNKDLINTRLAATYGGWIYCSTCNKNIGYLCYVTYDKLNLNYECNCGSKGSIKMDFTDSKDGENCNKDLVTIKNRLCCPDDESPLVTMLNKNLKSYEFEITCKSCNKVYKQKQN